MDIKESTLHVGAALGGAAFSPDSGSVFAYCDDSAIRHVNLSSGNVSRKVALSVQEKASFGVFNPGGTLVALSYQGGTVRLFDATSGVLKHKINWRSRYSMGLTFSPDSKLLATASEDHGVCVWDVLTGQLRKRVEDGLGESMAIAFTPSGDRFLACNSDTNVRLYRTGSGELEHRWEEFPVSMFQATYSGDGNIIAVGGVDRTIYLLNASNGEVLRRLTGQQEMIGGLALSPNGKWLLSSGMSELSSSNPVEIRLWALGTGETMWKTSFPRQTTWLDFSPDSRCFGAYTSEQIKIWSIV